MAEYKTFEHDVLVIGAGGTSTIVSLVNRQRAKKMDLRLLKEIITAVPASLKIHDARLEIVLVGAGRMARLNEKYLRHRGPTDVMAFDYSAGRRQPGQTPAHLRGEIFVCVDEAISQSRKFRTQWQSEIVRYIVHGILHLAGHDDSRPAARKKMKRAEDGLMRKLSGRFALSGL